MKSIALLPTAGVRNIGPPPGLEITRPMTLKTLVALSAIAVAFVAAAPTADAQQSGRRAASQSPSFRSQPSISGSRTQFAHRRGDRWGGHRHGNWHHRRHYPRYYPRYSPFYGHPFGYGYPYGYGYGYPYFGASAALYYHGYHPAPRERAYRPSSGGSVVAQVQQELARAGYYRGAVDGVIGNGTRSAIRAYERANGLRADGRIDQDLLRSMGIG